VQREVTELGCVEGAESSSISPDGSKVAMTRVTPESEPLRRTSQPKEYEIVLFDVASGDETVVATGAWSGYEPRLTWNAASTHLLIEWPVYRGL
jgi:beta-lactamase superfamily II metal-dependent hydrolase